MKESFVYILTNSSHKNVYVGMTNDLIRRLYEHEKHINESSYSAMHNTTICVYYETFNDIRDAIAREKQIKSWRREKKDDLINSKNPDWKPLANSRGFVRTEKYVPWAEQVKQMLEELKAEGLGDDNKE